MNKLRMRANLIGQLPITRLIQTSTPDEFKNKAAEMSMTLGEFYIRILRPKFIIESRELMSQQVGFKVTTLVWFDGRYRAMPH